MWTFEEVYRGALSDVQEAENHGVYKVFAPEDFEVQFNSFTDAVKDGTVKPVDMLQKRWDLIQSSSRDEGKRILYIGQTTRKLKERLMEFAKHGYGLVKIHHGGYPLWQISNNKKLLVEIYACDSETDPEDVESDLIDEYVDIYGTAPVANSNVGKNSKYRFIRSKDIYVLK